MTKMVLAGLLLALLRVYRVLVSPLLAALFGSRCRFYPTCSAYAEESIRRFGPARGAYRAARRLCRCHPFHPGGHDPVDPPSKLELNG